MTTNPTTPITEYDTVFVDRDGGCGIVTMNRLEKYNALNAALRNDIHAAMSALMADKTIRGIVLWGGTKAFVSGGDLVEMLKRRPLDAFGPTSGASDLWALIHHSTVPVVAAIAGPCFGGGLELAMACDLRVAADNALMGQTETNVGLIPGRGGTQRLVRLVGATRAKEMIFTGEIIKPDEAYRIGLVNKVVPAAQLLDEAKAYVHRIAEKSPHSIALAKLMINNGQDTNLDTALMMEQLAFATLFSTDDMHEGGDAFLNKRRPAYRGS
ncbi:MULTISPECIES: enoyl-CoA hydratase/isomerase family protein [Cupriavidus]|uniref:enoyl-CoA hydratase/isomerase family protein n=1 Tax=Cupriavidus TaxID=106589 RepID=UPI0003654805|nr:MULTISPECIES: enoyl-CoA hydratase/isomerase family protein [Cupriavidus]